MKALSIILGILLIAGGVLSIVNPAMLALSLGYLTGLFIMAHGVGSLITHYRFRSWGEGWGVAGAILSILLGAVLMTSTFLQFFTNLMLVFIAGVWMAETGVVSVILAFRLIRSRLPYPEARRGLGWGWLMLQGVLLIALGALAFLHPVVSLMTIGVLLGVYVAVSGVHLIMVACCRPAYPY